MNTTIDTRKIYEGEGRFGRATFLAWNFIIFLGSFAFAILIIAIYWSSITGLASLQTHDQYETMFAIHEALAPVSAFFSLINFVYLYFMFVFSIKRLHDLNKSGWFSLFNLIPIVNLFFAVWLSTALGDENKNDFGYPRPTRHWEYVLAWISIILFSIIGLALIIALIQLLHLI